MTLTRRSAVKSYVDCKSSLITTKSTQGRKKLERLEINSQSRIFCCPAFVLLVNFVVK